MLTRDPVKIPRIPGKIRIMKKDGIEYVRYETERTYDPEKQYNTPRAALIGRKIAAMPGLMYPNDNYDKYFGGDEDETEEELTAEEEQYIRENSIYGLYSSFFTGLYNEFRQQMRKKADEPINRYKAENINKVIRPLMEMMKGEEYAELLGLIETGEEGDTEMTYSDVMMLLTQYKSALAKYHRSHMG
ncbi:MAG: hypothetical protein IKE25_01940 [Clostridia bacterium]|nr:hypothetical protein [Clostridia bacterium]